ncbi:CPBP family intramembrane metalloprotease [candidate division WOR-3 bacterium]|nr:CPBP family intramembrane metalloprotease [candidate division WOR-3 bacterium]
MRLFKNPVMRMVFAIVMGLIVIEAVGHIEQLITTMIPGDATMMSWILRLSRSIFTVALCIVMILIVNRGTLTGYGFTPGENVKYGKIILWGFIIGVVTMVVTGIAATVLNSIFPIKGGEHFASKYSIWETILYVWLLASISEEVLTRGLIQGFLAPLKKYGFKVIGKYISLPILTSTFFFSAIHLMLLTTGMNACMVGAVVISCFVLGIVAGYVRERSGSLIPAIIVHLVFNVGGTAMGLLG